MAKIVQAIENKFGRLDPVIVDGAVFDEKKEEYYREMRAGRHFHETADSNYELLVDLDFIKKCAPEVGKLQILLITKLCNTCVVSKTVLSLYFEAIFLKIKPDSLYIIISQKTNFYLWKFICLNLFNEWAKSGSYL